MRYFCCLLLVLLPMLALCQLKKDSITLGSKASSSRLKVIIDCGNTWCDETFIRTEINIVDFMLDRVAADVHLLLTSQQNGNGGSQFQMILYGQNKFKNIKDTLRFNLDPNATDSERRDLMVKYMKLGLTPFIAKTDYAEEVVIQMKKNDQGNAAETSNSSTKDKWNYWVFRTGARGNIRLNQVYKDNSYSGNVSANRITDKLKVGFRGDAEQTDVKYIFEDSTGTKKTIVTNSEHQFEHYLIKSISGYWSSGYQAQYSNSTFSNNKSSLYLRTAIEYAIFPYKDVNNKFFTVSYGVDVRRNQYFDSTIYNKTRETLFGHSIRANLAINQKWGNINSSINYRNFFHDWKLNNLSLSLNVDVRITGGLSFYGYSFGALVRDQVYLPREGATEEEIFTRRREIASSYRFFSGFGISYRFGSKLNNFVNPRFNESN